MKKLIILMILLLAISVSAQEPLTGLTGKGIKVGIGMANLTGDDVEGLDMKMGINGGAFITYNFSPMFAIQPELLFTMKGAKESIEGMDDDFKYKFNYLSMPILLKVCIPTESNIKPSLLVGPEVSMLMSAKASLGDESMDMKDALKDIDFGLAFGGGIDVQMETMKLTFDARYTLGLSSIDDSGEGEESASVKNTNISVMVGLGF